MNENIELFVFRTMKYEPSTSTPIYSYAEETYAYVTVGSFAVILPRFIATGNRPPPPHSYKKNQIVSVVMWNAFVKLYQRKKKCRPSRKRQPIRFPQQINKIQHRKQDTVAGAKELLPYCFN
jgi:hypothetical protein